MIGRNFHCHKNPEILKLMSNKYVRLVELDLTTLYKAQTYSRRYLVSDYTKSKPQYTHS